MSIDLAAYPDAIPAEPGFFFVETTRGVLVPLVFITPVCCWLGVAPPAGPLHRALAPDGRLLVAGPDGGSAADPATEMFVQDDRPAPGSPLTWSEVYEAARPGEDGSPRRDWSALVETVCPPVLSRDNDAAPTDGPGR